MPTQLEMVFDFTADDLAANKQGELSESQQSSYQWQRKLYRGRVRLIGWMNISVIVLLIVNAIFIWVVATKIRYDMLAFCALVILGWFGIRRLMRPTLRFVEGIESGKVAEFSGVLLSDFTFFDDKPCVQFIREVPLGRLILNEDQLDALTANGVYRFLYWTGDSGREQLGNDILSVEQIEGVSEIISELEYQFDFLGSDLEANQKGHLSERQRRNLELDFKSEMSGCFTTVTGFALLCLSMLVYQTMSHLVSGRSLWDDIELPIFFAILAVLAILYAVYYRTRWLKALQEEKINVEKGVRWDNFTPVQRLSNAPFNYCELSTARGGMLKVTEDQLEWLAENKRYTFYLWSESLQNSGVKVLSVEEQVTD